MYHPLLPEERRVRATFHIEGKFCKWVTLSSFQSVDFPSHFVLSCIPDCTFYKRGVNSQTHGAKLRESLHAIKKMALYVHPWCYLIIQLRFLLGAILVQYCTQRMDMRFFPSLSIVLETVCHTGQRGPSMETWWQSTKTVIYQAICLF